MNFTTFTFFFFFALLAIVEGLPVLSSRDVFVPPVLKPQDGDVWIAGQNQTVAWYVEIFFHSFKSILT